jgi:hypothetical protein
VVLLRVAWAVPDVVEDMRERRVLWVLQGLAFAGLLGGGVLLLSPSRLMPRARQKKMRSLGGRL